MRSHIVDGKEQSNTMLDALVVKAPRRDMPSARRYGIMRNQTMWITR